MPTFTSRVTNVAGEAVYGGSVLRFSEAVEGPTLGAERRTILRTLSRRGSKSNPHHHSLGDDNHERRP